MPLDQQVTLTLPDKLGELSREVWFYVWQGRQCEAGWWWQDVDADGLPTRDPVGPFPTFPVAEMDAKGGGKTLARPLPPEMLPSTDNSPLRLHQAEY